MVMRVNRDGNSTSLSKDRVNACTCKISKEHVTEKENKLIATTLTCKTGVFYFPSDVVESHGKLK